MESIESLKSAVREYRDLTHETANKAADALGLLGLIERHDWHVEPFYDTGSRLVFTDECRHIAPTLIEALIEASRCPRCTGGET